MLKKSICLLSIASLLGIMTACGGAKSTTADVADNTTAVEAPTGEATTEVVAEPTPEPTPTPEEVIEEALTEGRNYYYGLNGVTADNDKALEAFQKAADLDSAEAYYYIGGIHSRAEEYDESIKSLEKAIELGNSKAKLALGDYYEMGYGVERDYAKAKELYEAAIEEGCIEANIGLGWLLTPGHGVEDDADKSLEYFETATTGDEIEWVAAAYRNLMEAYCGYYEGIDKDISKINEYASKYEELSKDWDPDYMGNIGIAYEYANEYDTAIEWYEKADTKKSLNQLGCLYYYGNGVDQDYAKAMEYFEKAANMGNPTSMGWVGSFYQNGESVEKNIDTAIEWYEKQGEAGDGDGYNEIGKLYYFGEDVEQDYSKALDYFLKGSDLKNTYAMLDAGMCYENGYGTDIDYDKACEFYAKADYYDDKSGGDSILDLLNAGKIDEATANKWMDYFYQ